MPNALWKDPLLQLIGLGAILYGLYAVIHREVPTDSLAARIDEEIAQQRRDGQFDRFEQLSPEEQRKQIAGYIDEELLFEEAKRIGLDHDRFIRERLIQKARFYLEGQFVPPVADEQTLRTFYSKHRENYKKPRSVSFEQRLLNAPGVSQIKDLMAQALTEREFLERIKPLQKESLLSTLFEDATLGDLQELFGSEFVETLVALPIQEWQGFVESKQGFHAVKLISMQADRISEYDEVRESVQRDWIDAQRALWLARQIDALRERYQIRVDDFVPHAISSP